METLRTSLPDLTLPAFGWHNSAVLTASGLKPGASASGDVDIQNTGSLTGVFTLALFFLGRSWSELAAAAARSKDALISGIAQTAVYVVPDLHLYSVSGSEVAGKHVSVHGDFVSWAYVGSSMLYGGAVIGVLLLLGMAIFQRRNFL